MDDFEFDSNENYYNEEYLEKLNNSLNVSAPNNKITSNLDYIKSSMNELKNKLNNSINSCEENHNFDSSKDGNNLYLRINETLKKYYNTEKLLMEKLIKEAEFDIIVGENYEKLDEQLKQRVEKI